METWLGEYWIIHFPIAIIKFAIRMLFDEDVSRVGSYTDITVRYRGPDRRVLAWRRACRRRRREWPGQAKEGQS
jgi:hypothetical protein